jgi:ABC-2 type transport system ATP-binding protein
MSEAIIEFRNIGKSYPLGFLGRRQKAVQGLTLSVPKGAIYGFLGANGAGKTTCIKILLGLQFADEGEVRVFGQDPLDPAAKRKIGFLPERPYFHDSMTAGDFLNFHRSLFGRLAEGRRVWTNAELLELVGLRDVGEKPLKGFSKGMLQRAGIAQALVNDPELIVMDEPMSGLDPVGRREVRDLILKLHALGKTIFFSTHILSDVEQISDRIAFLEKGTLRLEGDLRELLKGGDSGYEVSFRKLPESFASSRPALRRSGELVVYSCGTAEEAQGLISQAWAVGAELAAYQREHRSLEDFLFGGGRQ